MATKFSTQLFDTVTSIRLFQIILTVELIHGQLEEVIYQLDSLCNVFGDSEEQSLINLGNAELASDDPEDPLKLVLIEVRGLVTTRRREHQVDRVEQAGQRSRKGCY